MTALTPAQVRDHARALIELRRSDAFTISAYMNEKCGLDDDDCAANYNAIADAIRTARITVDWDEETAHA